MERVPPEIQKEIVRTYLQYLEAGRLKRILCKINERRDIYLTLAIEKNLPKAFKVAYYERHLNNEIILTKACQLGRDKIVKLILDHPRKQSISQISQAVNAVLNNKNMKILKIFIGHWKDQGLDPDIMLPFLVGTNPLFLNY